METLESLKKTHNFQTLVISNISAPTVNFRHLHAKLPLAIIGNRLIYTSRTYQQLVLRGSDFLQDGGRQGKEDIYTNITQRYFIPRKFSINTHTEWDPAGPVRFRSKFYLSTTFQWRVLVGVCHWQCTIGLCFEMFF